MGASAGNLRTTAIALCNSVAECYCTPVWSRSAHTQKVDVNTATKYSYMSNIKYDSLDSYPMAARDVKYFTTTHMQTGCNTANAR